MKTPALARENSEGKILGFGEAPCAKLESCPPEKAFPSSLEPP